MRGRVHKAFLRVGLGFKGFFHSGYTLCSHLFVYVHCIYIHSYWYTFIGLCFGYVNLI